MAVTLITGVVQVYTIGIIMGYIYIKLQQSPLPLLL